MIYYEIKNKMVSIKELLELRKQIKSKKPDFIRQDYHKKKRLDKKWRRPKGLHSKIRLGFKGKAKKVSRGYRSPRKIRGLHKSGLQESIIKSIGDLKDLDAKENCLVISSSLGDKKRIEILRETKELGFNILNIKDVDDYIKKVEDKIDSKRKIKKEKAEKKKEKEVKVKGKKEKLAEKVNEEEKQKMEKKEKDKVLTKRDK